MLIHALLLAALPCPAQAAFPRLDERLVARVPERFSIADRKTPIPDGSGFVTDRFSVTWSQDGSAIGYVGEAGETPHPVVGDEVAASYHYVSPPAFSHDGKHSVFRVGRRVKENEERWWALLDGKEQEPHDWLGEIGFAPDGAGWAAWSQKGARIAADGSYARGSQRLVTPWKAGDAWEDASSLLAPRFAADGSHVCTLAMKGGTWRLLLADKKGERTLGKPQPWIVDFNVTQGGKSFALEVLESGGPGPAGPPMPGAPGAKSSVVFGKETLGRSFDSARAPVLAPDGKQVAWILVAKGREGVAIGDGKRAEPCADWVRDVAFRPDGKQVAYFAGSGGTPAQHTVDARGRRIVEGAEWRLARQAVNAAKPELGAASYLDARDLAWSGDGMQLAFAARAEEGWRIVCGATQSEVFDDVGPPRFAPSGKQVAFGARKGRELWWKILTLPE